MKGTLRICESVPVLTLFKILQIAEFNQVVAIVIVCDVDLGVLGQRVFHPGPLVPSVAVVLHWHLHRSDGSLALHVLT